MPAQNYLDEKMFGKSKSEYASGALDPNQLTNRRHTTRSRLKSNGSERSSTDSVRVFGRPLDEVQRYLTLFDLTVHDHDQGHSHTIRCLPSSHDEIIPMSSFLRYPGNGGVAIIPLKLL